MERKIFRRAGVVLLVWESWPLPALSEDETGARRISAFYRALKEAEERAAEAQAEAAWAEYEKERGTRGRAYFPFYRLESRLRVTEDGPDFFSAHRTLALRRGSALLAARAAHDLFFYKSGLFATPLALRLSGYHLPRGRGPLDREGGSFIREEKGR